MVFLPVVVKYQEIKMYLNGRAYAVFSLLSIFNYNNIVIELNNFHLLTNATEGHIRVLQAEIEVGRGVKI